MAFKEIVTPSVNELFIQEMERMILSGELKVGDKLPTERELSKEMKVSRAVINGGLNKLAAMGFLKIAPRKGVFVNDYIASGNIDVLTAVMGYHNWRFSPEFLEPLLQFRTGIEPYMLSLAAQNATPEAAQALIEIVAELKATATETSAAVLVFKFYHTAAIASGNLILPLIFHSFEQVYTSIGQVYIRLGQIDKLIADFDYLCVAINERRQEDAKKRGLQSIEACRQDIGTHYQSEADFER
ncbi:FadR/GntR family transcriptional regulator [Agrilactobacillus yilanensis]|uniref:FadR/GntR family transcriptional regulator n=1 Tax=Agrilactobacillus yilanensis TaxID=2485997 RepID=A0ABW4J488_9LACO|nr:GntR family transcriptional regulator [Agrilactobacillus yilanensis]